MKLDNKTYDILKWIASYLLPGLTTFWLAVGKIWNIPFTAEIGATMAAVDVFMHTVLGISKKNYDGEGELIFDGNGNVSEFKIQNDSSVHELTEKGNVMVKVTRG